MRSSLKPLKRHSSANDANVAGMDKGGDAGMCREQFTMIVPADAAIHPTTVALTSAAEGLREHAQVISLASSAANQMTTMNDLAASALSQTCGEALSAFRQWSKASSQASDAQCASFASSADLADAVRTIASACDDIAAGIAAHVPQSAFMQNGECASSAPNEPSWRATTIDRTQADFASLFASITAVQSQCQGALRLADDMERAAAAFVDHAGETHRQQKAVGQAIERLGDTVQPLRQMANAHAGIGLNLSQAINHVLSVTDQLAGHDGDVPESIHAAGWLQGPLKGYAELGPLLKAASGAAAHLGSTLDQSIRSGLISRDALFDDLSFPIVNEESPIYTTASSLFLQQQMPGFMLAKLADTSAFKWAGLVDRNAYQPVALWLSPQAQGFPRLGHDHQQQGCIFTQAAMVDAVRCIRQSVLVPAVLHPKQEAQAWCEVYSPVTVNKQHWGSLRIRLLLERTGPAQHVRAGLGL